MVRRNQVFILTMVLFKDTFNNIYYLIYFFLLINFTIVTFSDTQSIVAGAPVS